MNKFKVLIKGWYKCIVSEGDILIENDEDALRHVGGYLCLGQDGKLKVIEVRDRGLSYYEADFDYKIIKNKL